MRSSFPALLVPCAIACLSPAAGPRSPAGEPARELRTEWHQVYLRDRPAGWVRIDELGVEGGGVLTRTRTRMVIARGATPLTLDVRESTEETATGSVAGYRVEQVISSQATRIDAKVRGAEVTVTARVGGSPPRSSRHPHDPDAIGPHRAEVEMRRRLRRPGDSWSYTTIFPQLQRYGRQIVTLGPTEAVRIGRREERLRRVDVRCDLLPGHPTTLWVDGEFRVLRQTVPVLGMTAEIVRSTQEEILRADYSSPPEIFLASAVRVGRRIPRTAERVVFRLRLRAPAGSRPAPLELPAASGQRVLSRDAEATRLEIRAVTPESGSDFAAPTDDLSPYLGASTYLQADDPEIRDLARKIVEGETAPWRRACRLERWVHREVKTKDLETGFATASEVARRRAGDCTEHAVLLAALARAVDLPSRVVAGLLYWRGSLVGHMWTEVAVDDRWYPLDATVGEGRVGADHVALSSSSLRGEAISELFLTLATVLGNLDVDVLEIE